MMENSIAKMDIYAALVLGSEWRRNYERVVESPV